MVQPNSYASERHFIPHDPDEKDRELDLTVEAFLGNSDDLKIGLVVWFPERKLRNLVPEGRIETLGPDLKPWIGWAEIKTMIAVINEEHRGRSYADIVLRFEHSGQALSIQPGFNTPWVARRSTLGRVIPTL